MANRKPETRGTPPVRTRRAPALLLAPLLALPALGSPALAPPAAAQQAIANAPDLSAVTTKAAARKLVREGRLVEISLFPTELGGPDDPMNMTWTTPEAADARDMVIGTLRRFVADDLIDQLDVLPEYRGDSIIPSRIVITGTHSEQEGSIDLTIEVW